MRVGYVRVSTVDQNTDRQLDGIEVERVFTDKASGKDTTRPKLDEMMRFVRDGDTVIVHSHGPARPQPRRPTQLVRDPDRQRRAGRVRQGEPDLHRRGLPDGQPAAVGDGRLRRIRARADPRTPSAKASPRPSSAAPTPAARRPSPTPKILRSSTAPRPANQKPCWPRNSVSAAKPSTPTFEPPLYSAATPQRAPCSSRYLPPSDTFGSPGRPGDDRCSWGQGTDQDAPRALSSC